MGSATVGGAGGSRARLVTVRVLVVVGAMLAALGVVAGYFNRELFDAGSFAEHVDAIRRDDAVAEQLGQQAAAAIIANNPDLLALRPLVEDVAVRVAGGDLLGRPTRVAARAAYQALVEGDGSFALRIGDVATITGAALFRVSPDVGASLTPATEQISLTMFAVGDDPGSEALARIAGSVDTLAWALPVAAVACWAVALALSRARWSAAGAIGRSLLWAGAAVGFVLVVGGLVVRQVDRDTLDGAVAVATWGTLVRPLWWTAAGLGVVGAMVWFGCDSAAPARLTAKTTAAWAFARSARPAARVLRPVLAAAVGLMAVVDPGGLVELVVTLAGLGLVVYALTKVAEVAGPAQVRAGVPVPAAGGAGSGRRRAVRYGVVGGAAVLVAATVVVLARPGRGVDAVDVQPVPTEGCNGHVDLCDRPYDEVAYVASHNAMSVASLPGWFIPEQFDPIPVQLDQGVRALLIDVWPGVPAPGIVRTAPGSRTKAQAVAEEELGEEAVAAAVRLTEGVGGAPTGPEALYLCHGLCEIGATALDEVFDQLRAWLAAHPDEVVTLFVEDHTDADLIAADVEAAGLLPYVYTPVPGGPWPTLGEMVESGQRLVVMLERGRGGEAAPWLVNGFEITQDTPYTFPTVEDFSCAPNRGPADAPLFLLNHWLAGFGSLVSNAEVANQRDVLLTRAEQCQEERGQIPNFVAVNFVTLGDVFEVVDVLNGVAG